MILPELLDLVSGLVVDVSIPRLYELNSKLIQLLKVVCRVRNLHEQQAKGQAHNICSRVADIIQPPIGVRSGLCRTQGLERRQVQQRHQMCALRKRCPLGHDLYVTA